MTNIAVLSPLRNQMAQRPPFLTFFRPTPLGVGALLALLPPPSEGAVTWVDMGAGRGYFASVLNEVCPDHVSLYPLDIITYESAVFPTVPLDATKVKFNVPNPFPLLARPCHGMFPYGAIRNAVSQCGFCVYIGLQKNVERDVLSWIGGAGYTIAEVDAVHCLAGYDDECIWIVGKDDPRYNAVVERARWLSRGPALAVCHDTEHPATQNYDRVFIGEAQGDVAQKILQATPINVHGPMPGWQFLLLGLKSDVTKTYYDKVCYLGQVDKTTVSYCERYFPSYWRRVKEFVRGTSETEDAFYVRALYDWKAMRADAIRQADASRQTDIQNAIEGKE